jgi:hypothetical protein
MTVRFCRRRQDLAREGRQPTLNLVWKRALLLVSFGAFLGSCTVAIAQENGTPINVPGQIGGRIAQCWKAPQTQAAQVIEVTVRVSFSSSGVPIGEPRVVYIRAPAEPGLREKIVASVLAAVKACKPLAFTPSLGAAIAGRMLVIRFRSLPLSGPQRLTGSRQVYSCGRSAAERFNGKFEARFWENLDGFSGGVPVAAGVRKWPCARSWRFRELTARRSESRHARLNLSQDPPLPHSVYFGPAAASGGESGSSKQTTNPLIEHWVLYPFKIGRGGIGCATTAGG